jgi:hypothetical protein
VWTFERKGSRSKKEGGYSKSGCRCGSVGVEAEKEGVVSGRAD